MEAYQVEVRIDGTAHVLHPSGARFVIRPQEWAHIQQQRAVLSVQNSKNIADSWYAQVLDSYALSKVSR
jgi:hypothetical protein